MCVYMHASSRVDGQNPNLVHKDKCLGEAKTKLGKLEV